jgi:type III pantothenate kinase
VNKFKNYNEIGADLVCSAVGAVYQYIETNLIIVDMGTATTITAINKAKEFLTGAIIPGLATQISSLASSAEKLFSVELIRPKNEAPRSTIEAIQTGVYYSHLGGIKLLIKRLAKECFGGEKYLIIGTGGYARLFQEEELFDYFESNLVLAGLQKIIEFNN